MPSGDTAPVKKSRGAVIIGTAAAVILLTLGAIFGPKLLNSEGGSSVTPPKDVKTSAALKGDGEVSAKTAKMVIKPEVIIKKAPVKVKPEVKVAALSKPDVKAAPTLVKVLLSSKPGEAEIFKGGAKIGVTPMIVDIEEDGMLAVTLKKAGYLDLDMAVNSVDQKQVAVLKQKPKKKVVVKSNGGAANSKKKDIKGKGTGKAPGVFSNDEEKDTKEPGVW